MLPISHRIATEHFPAVTQGKTLQNDLFRVVVHMANLKHPKCAVVVSNKIAKTAVVRNRIRRQVYSILGELLPVLPQAFISVFPKRTDVSLEEVRTGLKSLF